MIQVDVRNNTKEAFEKALSTFKTLCKKDGFIREINDKRYYKTPGERLKIKRQKAERNRRQK